MQRDDFSLSVIRAAINRQKGSSFYTGDICDDSEMQKRHHVDRMSKRERDTYRRMTGRFLSDHRADLSLRLTNESKPHCGRKWERSG